MPEPGTLMLRLKQTEQANSLVHAGLVTWRGSKGRQILQLTWSNHETGAALARVLSNDERKALRRALKRR